MINLAMLVLNTLLSLNLVFLVNKFIKETKKDDEQICVQKQEMNEMSPQEKRDLEILEQIQRYDGTRILRKEV